MLRFSRTASAGTILALVGLLAISVGQAGAATVTFQQGVDGYSGTVDTFLRGASPSTSFGDSVVIEWDGEDSGGANFGLLRFESIFGSGPGQIPAGVVISSATLTYEVVNAGYTASVNEVAVDWAESVTYNAFGGEAGVQTGDYKATPVYSATGSLGTNTLNVTASIAAWAAAPSTNKGWIFRPTGGTDGVQFASSEDGTVSSRPKLTVRYVLPDAVEIDPDHLDAVVGSANKTVTVVIPPGANQSVAVHVTLTTDNAAVAVPVGATGNSLVVTFTAGGSNEQMVGIDIGSAGSATISTTNDAGLTDDTLTVVVGAGQVTLSVDSLVGIENSAFPLTVSLSPGSNNTRAVQVTLTSDHPAVAEPAGATGGSRTLTFAAGASNAQVIDIEMGISGGAAITTSNNGGLGNPAALPVEVSEGFNFTASADQRDMVTLWDNVCAGINTCIGGPGLFHVSPGDIDPVPPLRGVIDNRFGANALWYPGIGNHEEETPEDMDWVRNEYNNGNGVRTALKSFTNQDGPTTTKETTYTWEHGNALFIMLNEYWDGTSDTGTDGDIVPALYNWLADRLAATSQPVVLVFGHEPAYPFYRHVNDSLDKYPASRDAFWSLLEAQAVQAYICGHTHVYKRYQPNPDGIWQIDLGNAGNYSPDPPDMQTFINVTVAETAVRYDVWRSTTLEGTVFRMEDTWSIPIGLKIGLSTTEILRQVAEGGNLSNDTFTVTARGPGTLNYTIADDADWLSVSPGSGSSTGEADPIDVIYSVSGLEVGEHRATITVSSDDAVNSPRTIDVCVTVLGPHIVLSNSVIDRTVFVGDNLPNDTFTVANGGGGVINYTVGDNVGWLSVVPESGSSTGEADPIEIVYDVADLPVSPTPYSAVITVSSSEADNSPQTLTVNVTVETVKPDIDGDGDVDQEDFGVFQSCLTGSGVTLSDPDCEVADFDNDNDVDGIDLGVFVACKSGPGLRANPTCDG